MRKAMPCENVTNKIFGITQLLRWLTPAPLLALKLSMGRLATSQTQRRAKRSFGTPLLGCAGAWSLHPTQIEIAKRVFSPDPAEVAFARRVLEAMPDGTGAVMIDGRMQDDATWKQCKVVVDLAKQVAAKDPDFAKIYGF